jgi:hypothetical protein
MDGATEGHKHGNAGTDANADDIAVRHQNVNERQSRHSGRP